MILGQFAGGPAVRTDYNQTDPSKADYLVGRENIAGHLSNKKNPHGVTYAQVGAAPSGYGLGEDTKTSADVNTEKTNGYFRTTSTTANIPGTFNHGAAHVRTYNASEVVQNIFRVPTGVEMVRYTTDGGTTWIEEYANPPMAIGTEYRTTKRYNSEVVYTKLIEYGALPNATSSSISVSNLNAKYIVSAKGMLDNGCPFPYTTTNDKFGYINLFVNGPITLGGSVGIRIETTTDCSRYNGYVLLEYTKNS